MIIVIKSSEGEYDDYREIIEEILNVDTTKSSTELETEHRAYQTKIINDNGINVIPGQPWALANPKKSTKKMRTLHNKLLKENNFLLWIKSTYTCESIGDFIEMFTY
jgi:hypothetical protein